MAKKSKQTIDFTQYHNKIARIQGTGWKIIAHKVGPLRLAQAENTMDGTLVNLMSSRAPIAMSIRQSLGVGNFIG